MKKFLSLTLALIMVAGLLPVITPVALGMMSGDGLWEYQLIGNNVRILKYHGTSVNVIFPATVDGRNVTEIGRALLPAGSGYSSSDGVFSLSSQRNIITGIVIPNGVTTIGDSAFGSCAMLTSVTFPDTLTRIGRNAFYYCRLLTDITIPNSVTVIGESAFSECSSLLNVTLSNNLTEISSYMFRNTAIQSIVIPNSVTTIGIGAFIGSKLTGIIIPDSVITIGPSAFVSTPLTGITIGNGVTTIGSNVFNQCRALTGITIPASVTSIGASAFVQTISLTNITVDPASSDFASENGILFNKDKTTLIAYPAAKTDAAYTIPDSVTAISASAFNGNAFLTGVIIPDSVITIDFNAFLNCTSLSSVMIGNGVTTLGGGAFGNCSSLEFITIPPNVLNLPTGIFSGVFFSSMYWPNRHPNFTILGVLGSAAHTHAIEERFNFIPLDLNNITLNVPETSANARIRVWGYAPPGTAVSVGGITATANANYTYTADITLPGEGLRTVTATAVIDGITRAVSKTVLFDPHFAGLTEFNAHSLFQRSNLLKENPPDVLTYYSSSHSFTFEVKLDVSAQSKVTEVFICGTRNGSTWRIPASYDPVKGVWVATDRNPNTADYISNTLWVEYTWESFSAVGSGIGTPDRDSQLLTNVNARAFVPGNNSSNGLYNNVNPNSGAVTLAPGLTVRTAGGNNQWVLDVSAEAVGVPFVLWAHANNTGEMIFVTFSNAGSFNIGNANGMNHIALVQQGTVFTRSAKIGYGRYRLVIDPAGYVYEAVPSNRLQGVKATAYEQTRGLWNAEQYEQENPLFTDNIGYYAWDVPPGEWQVKYELAGYETAHSLWMPVPPEQLEVNVGLVNRSAPIVTRASGYPDGIEIVFSRYMKLDGLNPANITVSQNGSPIPGTITLIDAEDNFDPATNQFAPQVPVSERTQFASAVRFAPSSGTLSGEVQLNISSAVRSYADTAMAAPFNMNVPIKPEPKVLTASNMSLEYGASGFLAVTLDTAAAGRTVTAVSDSPFIVSAANAVVDASGKASIPVTGSLPGNARITLTLQDTLLEAVVEITVGMPEPGQVQEYSGVIVRSTTPDNAVINLSTETVTLPAAFSVAAYSTDGGKKWKRGTLPAENRFPRLLNKGMTLHVTSDFDRKGKKPAADAQTITFPKIDARPKRNADKLKPFYGDENWVLAKKGSTAAVFAGLEYAPSSNGKTPDGNWLPLPQDGLPVLNSRATVLVRTAPTASRAASTAWRVRPAVFGKAPNYKAKNGEITVRANTYVSLPDGTVTLHREKKKIPVVSGMEVWNAATGRRPASLRQVV